MNQIYPYSAPIILNDDIFKLYGGDEMKTEVDEQRNAAYLIAEMTATQDLSTFLLPTTVTGTFFYVPMQKLITDYAYVQSVDVVRFLDTKEYVYYAVTGTANVRMSLRNDTYGIIDMHHIFGNCNCHSHSRPYPYQVQVMYTAGLPTGTATQPDVLLALTTYADIIMNEIIGYGNEAPGDVGVQSFKNQQYTESRVALLRTSFGTSARANFAHKLLTRLRKHRFVGLGV